MKKIICLLTFLTVFNAFAQDFELKKVTVAPYLSVQNYEHFKRLVLISSDQNIEFIDGFDFEWGFEYQLEIKEVRLSSELSDGTRYKHSLVRVVTKIKMLEDYRFKMGLTPNVYYDDSVSSFKKIDESTYRYLDKVNIQIPNRLMTTFLQFLADKKYRSAHFSNVNGDTIRLERL